MDGILSLVYLSRFSLYTQTWIEAHVLILTKYLHFANVWTMLSTLMYSLDYRLNTT